MKHFLTLVVFLSSLSFAQAQRTEKYKKVENISVTSSKAVFLGKTKAIGGLESSSEKKHKIEQLKSYKQKPENFKNRKNRAKVVIPELEHQGIDPVWQSTHSTLRNNTANTEPIVNIIGLGQGSPTDPTGSVGLDYYIQAVNATRVGVYSKDGQMIDQFQMQTLWNGTGFSSGGDPIILYDQEASRWILTEFAPFGNTELLIAISETSDPLGSYYTYVFSTPSFPDYPKFGIWADHLVVTSNEGGFGTLHQYFIEREALLNGEDARMQRVAISGPLNPEQGFIVSTPVDWEGKTKPEDSRPIVLKLNDSSWGEVANDAVELFRFDIDYENSNNTQVESMLIETTPFDGFPCWPGPGFACCPQPNGAPLDAIPEVIMNAPQYRNFGTHESMVLSFVTDVTDGQNHAGVRWMELRRESGLDWYLYQEGSYAPDANHRYMSGIGIDRKGNIALAYNISSDSVFAGIRYTGRYANDPLGIMTIPEVSVREGNSTLNTGGRFADYSHISVDPVNESTFWFTTEYAINGTSRTRIVAWELAQDTFDMSITAITNPSQDFNLTATEPITIEVANSGIETAMSYAVSYSIEGVEMESMTINDPLISGSRRLHTFNTTQDFSAFGEYNLSAKIEYPQDANPNNNEINKVVVNRPPVDLAIEVNGSPTTCSIVALVNIQLTNNGGQELTEAQIDITLDGNVVDTYNWNGSLSFGQSEDFSYLLTNIPSGINDYTFTVNSSGGNDFTPADNATEFQLTSSGSEGLIVLNLTFDEYPEETSWTIMDIESDEIIASGDNYPESQEFQTITEEICVNSESCYVFTIFDSYADGICCSFGQGGFELTSAQGEDLGSFYEEWGASYSVNFCAGDTGCAINITTDVQNEITDGTLGSILVNASGGQGPYTYSIDGGQSFQESNLFDNLTSGDYTIIILSNDGACQEEINVLVDLISNTYEILLDEVRITATPNPNIGFFDLKVDNYQTSEPFLNFDVLDAHGKIVQSRKMGNYSGTFVTQVSLLNYPDGSYFIRFIDPNINQLVKIIKLN